MNNKTIICSMGGGFTSTALMPRILLEKYDKKDIHFVNCVLPNEHKSMWKLFDAVAEKLGIEINYIAYHPENKYQLVKPEDRNNKSLLFTPFDIFKKQGFIGNSRNDPCSHFLKRETIFRYISDKYAQNECVICVGIHKDEYERASAIRENWQKRGYHVEFPIINEEKYTREQEIALLKYWYGVSLDLYERGFEHNNCAGACVKAGQRQWAQLWFYYPETFLEWEKLENEWNAEYAPKYGKEYTILKITRGKKTVYISLREFREMLEKSLSENRETFLTKFVQSLASNPGCMWCSSI